MWLNGLNRPEPLELRRERELLEPARLARLAAGLVRAVVDAPPARARRRRSRARRADSASWARRHADRARWATPSAAGSCPGRSVPGSPAPALGARPRPALPGNAANSRQRDRDRDHPQSRTPRAHSLRRPWHYGEANSLPGIANRAGTLPPVPSIVVTRTSLDDLAEAARLAEAAGLPVDLGDRVLRPLGGRRDRRDGPGDDDDRPRLGDRLRVRPHPARARRRGRRPRRAVRRAADARARHGDPAHAARLARPRRRARGYADARAGAARSGACGTCTKAPSSTTGASTGSRSSRRPCRGCRSAREIPIYMAGVNPPMIAAAGAVADGLVGHPLFTRRYVEEVVRPALAARRRAGRARRRRPDRRLHQLLRPRRSRDRARRGPRADRLQRDGLRIPGNPAPPRLRRAGGGDPRSLGDARRGGDGGRRHPTRWSTRSRSPGRRTRSASGSTPSGPTSTRRRLLWPAPFRGIEGVRAAIDAFAG